MSTLVDGRTQMFFDEDMNAPVASDDTNTGAEETTTEETPATEEAPATEGSEM